MITLRLQAIGILVILAFMCVVDVQIEANAGSQLQNACRARCKIDVPCSTASGPCHDRYVGCLNGCDRMVECSSTTHCERGLVCQTAMGRLRKSQCTVPCKTNAACRKSFGPDAVCLTQGNQAGTCTIN